VQLSRVNSASTYAFENKRSLARFRAPRGILNLLCSRSSRCVCSMARKKAQRQQETALVRHRTPDLNALLDRAALGDLRQLQAYLAAGGSPDALVELTADTEAVMVPLIHAIIITSQHPHTGLAECIALLIRAGTEVQTMCFDGTSGNRKCTAMALACVKECCMPLLALLQNGVDVNTQCDSDGNKPLHRAAAAGSLKHCKALIAQGATLSAVNTDGDTALHLAAQLGHASVMTCLSSATLCNTARSCCSCGSTDCERR
jgi:ankyrin repeat protein